MWHFLSIVPVCDVDHILGTFLCLFLEIFIEIGENHGATGGIGGLAGLFGLADIKSSAGTAGATKIWSLIIMRIETNNLETIFVSLMPMAKSDFEVSSFTDKESGKNTVKESPDGRVCFRAQGLKALALDEQGVPVREERDVTLTLIEPSDVEMGVQYKAAGRVWVTHWVKSAGNYSNLAVSITAERLVKVEQAAVIKKQD
uniref:Uncharacterized protein n=1 Tax=Pygoscelis antarcticus TaxID=79643 RepID=A0A7G7LKE9_PYGAN|nr:hypothetical protein [Pygoscelis antarcticus]